MKILLFLFVIFIQVTEGRRQQRGSCDNQQREPFSLDKVKNKKLGKFLQRMKVIDVFIDCFHEDEDLLEGFLRLSKHSVFYYQFYEPPAPRRPTPDFTDNFYIQVQQSLERQFDFEYRHLLLKGRGSALQKAISTLERPSSEQCTRHKARVQQYLQIDTSDIIMQQVQQFEVRVHRLPLAKVLSNVRVRYIGYYSESQQMRVMNRAFDLYMSDQYELELQVTAYKEVIQTALHLVFLVEGCPVELIIKLNSQQTQNMFGLKHLFFDYFNDQSPSQAQQQDVITRVSLYNPFGVELFLDELSLMQQNHKPVIYFRLFGRTYQKIRYDSVDEREKLQLTLLRLNSQHMLDLVFDNNDAYALDDLPNEIQGFLSLKMSSRTLSFWFMVPYQIKLCLSSELKVPSYLDIGTFYAQYAPLSIFNKAVLMVSTGSSPIIIHDILVSVDSALFDIVFRVNQKHIQQGNKVILDTNIRKQALGSLQLKLKKTFYNGQVHTHFDDDQQLGLISIFCLVDKVFSIERVKIYGKIYPQYIHLSMEGPYLLLNNKSIKDALNKNIKLLDQNDNNHLHLQCSAQDDHLQVQLLKDYSLPMRQEGAMHAFYLQEIDAGQHSSLSAPHTLLKILRNIRIKLVYQRQEGRQNTLLHVQFQINYALNHVCMNPASLCALLQQPCYFSPALLSPLDLQLGLSNYKTFFQLSDENYIHNHPLFIFDGGLLCVSTANELQKLIYIHKHINNFSLEQYLCRHQSIDLGILLLSTTNRKTFYLINKNPVDVVMSYFDIEGEYIYQDYYQMTFSIKKYGRNTVLASNIQENLVLQSMQVYQVTVKIKFFRPITSGLADLQLIYESKYEDQEVHLKYQLQSSNGKIHYEQQYSEQEGPGWMYSHYNSSILLVNKHIMDIHVNRITLRKNNAEIKIVMKDQVIKVNNRHRYNIDLQGLLLGIDIPLLVQIGPPNYQDLIIKDYLAHYQQYQQSLDQTSLYLLVDSDLETIQIPFFLLKQDISLEVYYQKQPLFWQSGLSTLDLGSYQLTSSFELAHFHLDIHNTHFQPVSIQTMVAQCLPTTLYYPYIQVLSTRLVVLHQEFLILCLGESYNDFLEASFPRLSYDKYMISKEYLRYLAQYWQLPPYEKQKLDDFGRNMPSEGQLCLQFESEWDDLDYYKLWLQALNIVTRQNSPQVEQQSPLIHHHINTYYQWNQKTLLSKIKEAINEKLFSRIESAQNEAPDKIDNTLFQQSPIFTQNLLPNSSVSSLPFYVLPYEIGHYNTCIYIKNSLNALQVVNVQYQVLEKKILVVGTVLQDGSQAQYSQQENIVTFHRKYTGQQIKIILQVHTHANDSVVAIHSSDDLSLSSLQSSPGNSTVLFIMTNNLDSWYSPYILTLETTQENIHLHVVFQYKYLSEQQIILIIYSLVSIIFSLLVLRLLPLQKQLWPAAVNTKVMPYRVYANTVPHKAFSAPCLDNYLSSLHSSASERTSIQESRCTKHQATQLDESLSLLHGAKENQEYYQYFGNNLIQYKQLFGSKTEQQQLIFRDVYAE